MLFVNKAWRLLEPNSAALASDLYSIPRDFHVLSGGYSNLSHYSVHQERLKTLGLIQTSC